MHSKHKPGKLKFYSSEKWALIKGFKGTDGQRYAVSNYGRVIAYWNDFNTGYFLKTSFLRNYPGIQFRNKGTGKSFLVHRLVAQYFCEKKNTTHKFVIHLDHKKENNYYRNLKWVTHGECIQHMKKDPNYIKSKPQFRGHGLKLTSDRVKLIKRKLSEGKTRKKLIAKQFGISVTLIDRIKAGTNWGHVKV